MNYSRTDPLDNFTGAVVFFSPHMDDIELACGGTIAHLHERCDVHIVYATDGARSPSPLSSRLNSVSSELREIRRAEALAATAHLGVTERNVHFLDFPEGKLSSFSNRFETALDLIIHEIHPTVIFIPFRYDKHKDHLAVNRSVNKVCRSLQEKPRILEYFVYYKSRLLPGADVRKLVQRKYLIFVDISRVRSRKKNAIMQHKSQVTRFYAWQSEPILSDSLVHEFIQGPEVFVTTDTAPPRTGLFSRLRLWIKLAHDVEPILKRSRDKIIQTIHAFLRALR